MTSSLNCMRRSLVLATNESPTFEEYGSMILEITSRNRNTFSQYDETKRFNQLCKTFGKMQLSDIKASHIMKWQHECGLAPKTIRGQRSIFNMILEMAHYDDLISKESIEVCENSKNGIQRSSCI